jgi:hypothetical protein
MGHRAEVTVLAILLGLVGFIIVGSIVVVGLAGIRATNHTSGGVVYIATSCPPPPSGSGDSAGCNGD